MATGSIHHPFQAPITCNICDGSENVDWFCLMCKGPMCGTCQPNHTQTTMFRKHQIVPIAEGLKHTTAEEDCTKHPSYICSNHCNVCNELVCSKCISSGKHKGHDFGEIESAIQRVKQEIREYQDTLETRYLLKCKMEEKNLTQVKADYKKAAMSLKSDINHKRAELITEINKVCDNLISEADDEEKQTSLQIDKSLHKVQENVKEIELLITQSKEARTKLLPEIIKFNQEKPSLSHLDVQEAPKIRPPTFAPATINTQKLAEQVGKLQVSQKQLLIDTSILHRTTFDKEISLIAPVDEKQAWVKVFEQNELRLVDTDGTVVKHISTKFDTVGFDVTTSGNIIVTAYNDRCIRIMTQTGQVTQTIDTKPNIPTGVCLGNNDQEIIVCVNTSDKTRSKLVVYRQDGKEIRTITYTEKPVKWLITQMVTQNTRGDYCVAHHDHNKVYVVDTNGGLRWTYDGSGAGKMEKDFSPGDICSDNYNDLITSDFNNQNIHMLDGEGNFLRLLSTEQVSITKPYGLCIDKDGRLWVGQMDGGLSIIKYLK